MKRLNIIIALLFALNLTAQNFNLINGSHNSSEFEFEAIVIDDAMYYVGKDSQGYPGIRKYDSNGESSVLLNSEKLGYRNPTIYKKANNGFLYVQGLEKEVFYCDGNISSLKSLYKVDDDSHNIKEIFLLRDGFIVYAEQGFFTNKYSATFVDYEGTIATLLKTDIRANSTSFYQSGDIVCIDIATDDNLYFVNINNGESANGKDLITDAACDEFSFIGGNINYITYGCQNNKYVYDLGLKKSKEGHIYNGSIFENQDYVFSKKIPSGVSVTNKESLETRYIDESNSATECINDRYHYTKRDGSIITVVATNGIKSEDLKYMYKGPTGGNSARHMEIRSTVIYQGSKYSLMRQYNDMNLVTYDDEELSIDIVANVCERNCSEDVSIILLGEEIIVPKYDSEQGWEYFLFDPTAVFTSDTKIYEANIYPNPANQFFEIKNVQDPSLIEIFDMKGEKVLTKFNDKQVDISLLGQGVYIVKIVDKDNKKFFAKLQKVK